MPDKLLKDSMRQIISGINECHKRRIIHRDLKPQNILVDITSNSIKIADFGLARNLGFPARAQTNNVSTRFYKPPEILLGSSTYDCRLDMWAIGCIMAEMYQYEPLFKGQSDKDQIHLIFQCFGNPTEETWPGVTRLK